MLSYSNSTSVTGQIKASRFPVARDFLRGFSSGVSKIVQTAKSRSTGSALMPTGSIHTHTHILLLPYSWWSCPGLIPLFSPSQHKHAHRSWPLCCFQTEAENAPQFPSLPHAFSLRKTLIYVLQYLSSNWALACLQQHDSSVGSVGTAPLRHANMSGKPEGEDFGMERRTWSKKRRGAKVHSLHFYLITGEKVEEKR